MTELLRDAAQHLQELFRAEARLVEAEVREEVRRATSATLPLALGALSAVSGWSLLLWAAVHGLAQVMPLWAASLIVAAASGVLGALLLMAGVRRLKRVRAVPHRTVATMKENLAWIRPSSR